MWVMSPCLYESRLRICISHVSVSVWVMYPYMHASCLRICTSHVFVYMRLVRDSVSLVRDSVSLVCDTVLIAAKQSRLDSFVTHSWLIRDIVSYTHLWLIRDSFVTVFKVQQSSAHEIRSLREHIQKLDKCIQQLLLENKKCKVYAWVMSLVCMSHVSSDVSYMSGSTTCWMRAWRSWRMRLSSREISWIKPCTSSTNLSVSCIYILHQ